MIGPQASLASPRELPDSEPRVTPTQGGLRVVWHAGTPQVQTDSEGRTHVTVPGYELLDLPGIPSLPFSSVLVALPPDSKPVLSVLSVSQVEQSFGAKFALGNLPEGVELDSSGRVIGGAYTQTTEEVSQVNQVISLEPIGIVRGIHLARLSFYPVVQNGEMLRVTSSLEVEVNFGPALQRMDSAGSTPDPMRDLVRAAVVNPEQIQIAVNEELPPRENRELQSAGSSLVAVEISSKGITDITYASLISGGFIDGPVNLNQISLTRDGAGIAYDVVSDDNGTFEPGEIIRFFADPRFSRWSTTDTYILNLEGPSGIPINDQVPLPANLVDGIPWAEASFEENKIYTPACYCAPIPEGHDGDRWVWDHLLYTEPLPGEPDIPVSEDYTFQVYGLDNSQESILRIWLIGQTEYVSSPEDHQIDVSVNGHYLGTRKWDGKNPNDEVVEVEFVISATYLNEGDNTLTISLPGIAGVPFDGIWLDAFSIRYALANNVSAGESIGFIGIDHGSDYTVTISSSGLQAYDITNPEQPEFILSNPGNQVTISDPDHEHDHEYWVTTTSAIHTQDVLRPLKSLSTPPGFGSADYVIIAPEQFIPSLDPLVAMHQSDGLQVVVEDVQAIYDVFGGGRSLPNAIRDFLKDAYDNWDIPPLYVLLVGDGTHDPKNYQETSSATFIPPFLEVVDPWAGETAADNRYVTLDGSSDKLPDMLIGRLPANNISELDTMVSKIVDYAEKPIPEPWQHQAVFVADNSDFGGGNFPLLSDTLINKLPSNSLAAQRLYYSPDYTPGEFRSLVNQVWDDGNGLIMFTGHSSIHQWAHEILFHLEDVPGLDNGGRLPVVLEMTCFTGSFQIHDFPTLDEDLLRQPGGGAVAVWGATGLGIATGHHWLAEGFMETIYQDGISEIGSAALAGKLNLAAVGSNPDLIDTFTLLGDPATKLERSYQIYVPITKN